ncbi:hypothetical protein LJC08_05130 [Methanimicrococcus sp. OttesenSCG-928-J09]|nr:hypothetical protein [Methanimicrococcus sp. OttesenSCG-928-J09]
MREYDNYTAFIRMSRRFKGAASITDTKTVRMATEIEMINTSLFKI